MIECPWCLWTLDASPEGTTLADNPPKLGDLYPSREANDTDIEIRAHMYEVHGHRSVSETRAAVRAATASGAKSDRVERPAAIREP